MHYKSVATFIFNDHGELALQLRAAQDDSYPLYWDASSAGGIGLNEDHKAAAKRELMEEIGVEADVMFIGKELYKGKRYTGEPYTADLYVFKAIYNGEFKLQIEEVEDLKFFSIESIKKMLSAGQKFHPEFISLWNTDIVQKMLIEV